MSMRSRVSGSFRALSVSIACFLVFSQLSAFLHFIVVQHSVCAEHGELIHAGAGDSVHSSAESSPFRADGETVDSAEHAPGADTGHGHDHCSVCAQRREIAAFHRAPGVVPPNAETELVLAGDRGARILSSVPLYLLAPKNSPPA
jgi:hypothetical protein